jgi:hypothetical protein
MFDQSYDYIYQNYTIKNKGELEFKEHKLSFNCRFNHKYIINVEEYNLGDSNDVIFIIKFHLKSHTDSDHKYNLLTKHKDAPRLIRTCVNVMIKFFKDEPTASFGFIGANSLSENREETKRFNIYKKVMENFFSPVHFAHHN